MSEARQIQAMIDFIEREALEKAEELESAAQEEYDVEKMRLVEAEKEKIRATSDKKRHQVDVDRRVARANFSKTQRLRVMEERARIMEQLHEATHQKILNLVKNPSAYKELLKGLICQSLRSIQSDAILHCRREDQEEVKRMIPELQQWFQKTANKSITIQTSQNFLVTEDVWGGIVATSTDGRITCNNTLAYRTKTCLEEQLPTVRYYLFNPESSIS